MIIQIIKIATSLLLAGIVLYFSVIALVGIFKPYDNSDGYKLRSGLTIHTDALTGCQYLSRNGILTPRVDADGKHICVKVEDEI